MKLGFPVFAIASAIAAFPDGGQGVQSFDIIVALLVLSPLCFFLFQTVRLFTKGNIGAYRLLIAFTFLTAIFALMGCIGSVTDQTNDPNWVINLSIPGGILILDTLVLVALFEMQSLFNPAMIEKISETPSASLESSVEMSQNISDKTIIGEK